MNYINKQNILHLIYTNMDTSDSPHPGDAKCLITSRRKLPLNTVLAHRLPTVATGKTLR